MDRNEVIRVVMAGLAAGSVCGIGFLLFLWGMMAFSPPKPEDIFMLRELQAITDVDTVLSYLIFAQLFVVIGVLCSFLYWIFLHNKKFHRNKDLSHRIKFLIVWILFCSILISIGAFVFHYKPIIAYSFVIYGMTLALYELSLVYYLLEKSEIRDLYGRRDLRRRDLNFRKKLTPDR